MNFKIEKMSQKFVEQVAELESKLIAKTSTEKVLKTLNSDSINYFVLLDESTVIGFVEGQFIAPEAELFDIAIDENYQGLGLSKLLMDYFIDYSKKQGIETIFLEVNTINQKAINLYSQFGFEKYSIRKKYYGDNDAILMKKTLWCFVYFYKLKYLKFGNSKKFIVFLHGWGANKNSFLWLKDYFNDYSLLFVDFYGFGESPKPSKPYYLSDYVAGVYELISKFEIDELILVGHSFGGRVAIKFAFLHQNEYKVFRLCLIDSAGMKPRRGLKYYINVLRYKRLKQKAKSNPTLKAKLEKFGSSDYKKLSQIMKQTFVNIVNENLEYNAKMIVNPTLIIWGENDNETKLFMARRLNKLIKNSKLEIIKGAGHFSFLDERQEFLILLDTFIKN